MTPIVVELPLKTTNPSNGSFGRSYHARAKRTKLARRDVGIYVHAALAKAAFRGPLSDALAVTITRLAPSAGLDEHDNLRSALKHVVDGVADALGLRSDRDPRIRWVYAQERSKPGIYGVRISIERASEGN